jgi:hypothetical protein
MCRPIPGNSVRPKYDCNVKPLEGSTTRETVALHKHMTGLTERQARHPDFFIILFPFGECGHIRAMMHHTRLKGVET